MIEYDTYLNKVKKVNWADGRWITFTYNGASELIQRKSSAGDTWDYANGIIYKNNVAYQIPTPEGRIVNNAGTWAYEYEYRDHLGNLRVGYTKENGKLKINQLNTTDPWGFEISALSANSLTKSNFKYQGKEEIKEIGWIDFGARMYDPARGQFTTVDPLADHPNQVAFTPYNAFWNNPVMFTDPDGRCPSCPQGEEAAKLYAAGAQVENKDGSWTWTGKEWQTNQTAQVSDRQVASAMPFNTAFGMGAYAGLEQTGQFLSSLTTTQGWKDLGEGFVNMAKMGSVTDPEGMMMRAETAMAVDAYANNIPNMTAGEVAYDLGYGSEKVAEAVLTRKVMPVTKTSLGLPKGFGSASKYTNMVSYGLKRSMGQLPFSVRTPLVGLSAKSRDLGIVLSRNLVTPVGYGIGVGQLQYLKKR
ncbi:RHS repeat domain-containing protein [Lacihabitans lacunae]|uniref:RHS repeat domain-containing protein n=1 Tax=Lacihabitans lacunae TaxID=1028214 RepID=A0ABV7Z1Z5_9BACT